MNSKHNAGSRKCENPACSEKVAKATIRLSVRSETRVFCSMTCLREWVFFESEKARHE